MPLVFVGSYFGYKSPALEDPVRTNKIPRQIPEQPWYMNPVFSILIGGILPFGAVFIELFFILTSMWLHQFYYLFGFLCLVFVILVITCAEITIVLCYFQLCSEDYRWWCAPTPACCFLCLPCCVLKTKCRASSVDLPLPQLMHSQTSQSMDTQQVIVSNCTVLERTSYACGQCLNQPVAMQLINMQGSESAVIFAGGGHISRQVPLQPTFSCIPCSTFGPSST